MTTEQAQARKDAAMSTPATTTVKVEDAPIGVQIWPTIAPEFAPNFTLDRIEVVRTEVRSYVRWVYQSGTVRVFRVGEEIAISLA
jgi:hypothetical protein